MAGAALSQGQVQISSQAQHFHKVKCRFRGRRSGQVQISRQGQHFRKVKCIFHGRRIAFARSSTDIAAGAALSQLYVH